MKTVLLHLLSVCPSGHFLALLHMIEPLAQCWIQAANADNFFPKYRFSLSPLNMMISEEFVGHLLSDDKVSSFTKFAKILSVMYVGILQLFLYFQL